MVAKDNPYRRFSLLMAAFLIAGTALVAVGVDWQVQAVMIRQTASDTYEAVNRHQILIGLPDALGGIPSTGEAHDHSGSSQPAATPPSPAWTTVEEALRQKDKTIRLHLDIYDIKKAVFVDRNGKIIYSYDRADVGQAVAPSLSAVVAEVLLDGKPHETASFWFGAKTLQVVQPVENPQPGAPPLGAVIIDRDLSPLWPQVRSVQFLVTGIMLALAAALFLSLRQVFLRATLQIRSQTHDLAQALALIESTYDSTLKALTAALDFRDTETEGHSQRVTLYALRLAQEMGIKGADLVEFTRGALLHDVGKIGVPDSVLRKPGPLTQEEWQLMRQHPTLGYEMLKEIPFLRPALPVVLHHHERFDGGGYPAGLKGEAIPLGARIFAVCDTLDAMCSNRPYRTARSFAEARAEVLRMSGTQFDPAVVEAFLRVPESDWEMLRTQVPAAPGAEAAAAASM